MVRMGFTCILYTNMVLVGRYWDFNMGHKTGLFVKMFVLLDLDIFERPKTKLCFIL